MIAPGDYDRQFGKTTARELVRDHVLRLTYTSHDMAPFARDLGYVEDSGEPARRSPGTRRSAGTSGPGWTPSTSTSTAWTREDAGYVLDTFPIVRRQDEAQLRPLPHPRPHPRLHERPLRRRRGDSGGGVAAPASPTSSFRPPHFVTPAEAGVQRGGAGNVARGLVPR